MHYLFCVWAASDNPQTCVIQSSGHGVIHLFYVNSVFHQVMFSLIWRTGYASVAETEYFFRFPYVMMSTFPSNRFIVVYDMYWYYHTKLKKNHKSVVYPDYLCRVKFHPLKDNLKLLLPDKWKRWLWITYIPYSTALKITRV